MPFLDTPRHEIFAKARAKGVTLDDAYELAGFASVRGHSSRLAQRPDVAARIAELRLATAGWEETTGQAIVTAMLRMADARDYFDSPQRMKETRLTLHGGAQTAKRTDRRARERAEYDRERRESRPDRREKPAKTLPETCQNLPRPSCSRPRGHPGALAHDES